MLTVFLVITDDSLVTGDRKGEKTSDHSEEEESWDKMFDDDGECLDPHALDEVVIHITGTVFLLYMNKINFPINENFYCP